jgi:hypothetical protein
MKTKAMLQFAVMILVLSTAIAAETQKEELRLVGVMTSHSRFVLFVAVDGEKAKQLDAIGSRIGRFELIAFDAAKGYADFKKGADVRRLWLADGHVRSGGMVSESGLRADQEDVIVLPPLETIKGLIGVDEAIADGGREVLERILSHQLNRLPPNATWEERKQKLADLIDGKSTTILTPRSGLSEAFIKKYNLTPQQVESINWGEAVKKDFQATKSADKKNSP